MAQKATAVHAGMNALVITGLIICTVIGGVLVEEGRDAALLVASTKELAQELRQSSDDLTRFIRTYAVTGNESYWEYYQEVIKIRNGEAPLPKEPWRNHWDLYISGGHAPREYGPPASLADRMRAAKLSDSETELLEEAKRQSDALTVLEEVAANAMQGRFRPSDTAGVSEEEAGAFSVLGPANQTLAVDLVHSLLYHSWKGRVMRLLDDVAALSNKRVLDAIDAKYRVNLILVAVRGCLLAALIGLLLVYFLKVQNDAQVTGLLTATLPMRVVESVPVRTFSTLRTLAAEHAAKRRKNTGVVAHVDYPVLHAEVVPMAWVALTDVVGFASLCRATPAKGVISVLNELFSILDAEATAHGVEKIKTAGDAFTCARLTTSELLQEGQGRGKGDIANDGVLMVKFLLRALRVAQEVQIPVSDVYGEFLSLRAGLHVGSVASGVVGFERPLYDVFGDTVNTAALLQASGRPDRVHVMGTTMARFGQAAKGMFCDGTSTQVDLKGIGEVATRLITAYHGSGSASGSGGTKDLEAIGLRTRLSARPQKTPLPLTPGMQTPQILVTPPTTPAEIPGEVCL